MSSVSIAGNTSGSILLAAPDVAGSSTITLPTTGGTVVTTTRAGTPLQVVTGFSTTTDTTSSSSYVATSLSASITPISSTSKILIMVSSTFDNRASGGAGSWAIYRGATQLGNASYGSGLYWGQSTRLQAPVAFNYVDSPATTSSTTYAVYQKLTGGSNMDFNTSGYATIILMELAA